MFANRSATILRIPHRQAVLAAVLFCSVLLLMILLPGKASAMSAGSIPSNVAPLAIRQDIADHCTPQSQGGYGWTSVMEEWISAPGTPTATSINVPYGTRTVRLQLNYITYRCLANIRPSTQGASIKINDTDPNISALIGRVDDFTVDNNRFVPNSRTGYRSGNVTRFNYNVASPGLISDKDVIIKMTSQGTLNKNGPIYGAGSGDSSYNCNATYSSCDYCALVGSEYQHPTSSLHNFNPAAGYCKNGPGSFRIRINVISPALLDGVKIDDSKTGTYGGDHTDDAYMDLSVSVSGVGSTKDNPFYFDKSGRGEGPIPVGSGGTTRTVKVSKTGLGAGWVIAGYSICDATVKDDCNSTTMKYGGKYYNATSANSFTHNFKPGHRYHMRWIFRNLVNTSCGSLGLDPPVIDMTTRFMAHPSVNLGTTAYVPTTSKITLTIESSSGGSWSYGPVTHNAPVDGSGTATASFGLIGPITSPGEYTATWVYDANGSIGMVCTEQIPVVNMPYLTVYGGDTLVGASASTDISTCYTDPDAGAYSWNNHGRGYLGAGSQYAVMAMGQIQDFASNLGGNGSGQDPKKLSFANTDTTITKAPSGLYGGKFGGTATSCDLISDLVSSGVTKLDGTQASAQMNGGLSLGSGDQKVIYASGDVRINKNIIYSDTSWTRLSDIPSFRLVVEGNIYIDADVTRLDGLYVALPDASGNGGVIYTCSHPLTTAAKPTDSDFFTYCGNKLVVNGAFAAKQVQFLRTRGSIGQAKTDTVGRSHAAEQFNYSPEVWLPRGVNDPSMQYDSITGLPPIL